MSNHAQHTARSLKKFTNESLILRPIWFAVVVLATLIFTALVTFGTMGTVVATSSGDVAASTIPPSTTTTPTTPTTTPPPITADPLFEPQNAQLSNCVGNFIEGPNCGAKGRGGWRQTLVFLLLVAGLAFIAWRIVAGARKQRSTD